MALLLTGCGSAVSRSYIEPESHTYAIESDTEIIDQVALDEGVTVILDNLSYAENENIEGYLTTISSQGHENTRSELVAFFEDYDLEHTVLSVTLLDQEPELMLIEVEQQTVASFVAEDVEEYRDHVSIANHTLELEEGEWKITETLMTETFFID